MAFSPHDIVPDSPINNFATMNPLAVGINKGTWALDDGNLHHYGQGNSTAMPTIIPSTQPIYFELLGLDSPRNWYVAFSQDYDYLSNNYFYGSDSVYLGQSEAHNNTYQITANGNATFTATVDSTSFSYNGVIGVYANPVTLQIKVYADNVLVKDFVLVNTFTSGKPLMICPSAPMTTSQTFNNYTNFGQDHTFGNNKAGGGGYQDGNGIGQFYYDPPTVNGEKALALCTANIPEGPIKLSKDQTPSDNFKALTYTGQTADSTFSNNGNGTWSQTGVGFQPDLVWIKARSTNYSHIVYDAVRGTGTSRNLSTNEAGAEGGNAAYANLTAFESDGFTVGTTSGANVLNHTNIPIVAWCWKAAGAPDQDYASANDGSAKIINEDGSANTSIQDCAALATAAGASNVITPSKVSANRQNGFSIVKYQGASASNSKLPHGLTQAPEMVIIKNLDNTTGWVVGNDYLTNWGYIVGLNLTNGQFTAAGSFDSTAPTSSIITLGNSSGANNSSYNYIAYCWHSVEGYSKFGSYTGNGSADGPFVECGFRPAWVMVKATEFASSWVVHDSARSTSNPSIRPLSPDLAKAETDTTGGFAPDSYYIDFLSNGFKIRNHYQSYNSSGNKYIFMAFAEQPFSGPSNAR